MAAEEAVPSTLNYIPEVVLKKRKNNEQWAIRRKLQLEERAKRLKSNSQFIKKPEQFIREYRDKELDLIQMKSRGKRKRRASTTQESNLLFVVRIQGKNDMHPKTRKILYSLRLRKIFSGVFVKANEGLMEILQKVEPYVTYGYPNIKSVKDLIYKKGVIKVGKERIPLTDNNIVEQELGQHKIICIEDMVNEIVNVGPNFKSVTSFLCPFVLNNPEKALQGKKKRFEDGGDSGNRKDLINELIIAIDSLKTLKKRGRSDLSCIFDSPAFTSLSKAASSSPALVFVHCFLRRPHKFSVVFQMGSKSDEESDISDSEIREYKEVTYKLLKFRTHKIRAPNGKFRCPFCADKEQVYLYTHLLQHAIQVAEGSEDSAKQRANHFAMATYLVTDLADEAEPPPESSTPSLASESDDHFKNAMDSVQGCYQKLFEKLKEKEDELSFLISKEYQSNCELQKARKELIEGFQGLKDMPSQSQPIIGVKKMGELDMEPFTNACQKRFHSRLVNQKAAELCSSWQEKLKNPEWHPFLVKDCKGTAQRVIKDDDKLLKGLKAEWGIEIYDAVVVALEELQEYNASGCYPVPELWNFEEMRKADLGEVIMILFTQMKMLLTQLKTLELKTLKRKRT